MQVKKLLCELVLDWMINSKKQQMSAFFISASTSCPQIDPASPLSHPQFSQSPTPFHPRVLIKHYPKTFSGTLTRNYIPTSYLFVFQMV